MKLMIKFLIVFSLAMVFLTTAYSQEEDKQECFKREDGTPSCSAPDGTDPMGRFHVPDNTGNTTGSAKPLVIAPGVGNTNNGCPFCNSDYDLKVSDQELNAQPDQTSTSGSNSGSVQKRK